MSGSRGEFRASARGRATAITLPRRRHAAERLVHYLLFPVLLFTSTLKSPLQPAQTLGLAAASTGVMLTGIAVALAIGRWPGIDARLHASGAQTAYRFNSFIALAVPLANVAAVWPLARRGGHAYGRELLRNPLILSTGAGADSVILTIV